MDGAESSWVWLEGMIDQAMRLKSVIWKKQAL